ncbi:MAG: trypsin-like serine peptidase [Geminicoccales bacterium]
MLCIDHHRTSICLFTSLSLFFLSGTAIGQDVSEGEDTALNEAVSTTDAGTPAPTSGGGGAGIEAFAGTDTEAADDSLAEFADTPESVDEVWELLSLPPTTAEVGIESIIPPDQRVRVHTTTVYPYRAIALITFTGGRCTGWLYGKDVVATAGHCIHSGGSGGSWKTNVRVYPGRNGPSSPYGSCSAKSLHSVIGWTRDRNERYDYGAIKLNCNIGNTTGWFGLWWQGASLNGTSTEISGYPGDKPLENWRSFDRVRVSEANQIFYFNDTLGGMSGSPVFTNRPSGSPWCVGHCVMGVHAYGLHGSPPHSNHNHGTRFTKAKFDNLIAWRNLP